MSIYKLDEFIPKFGKGCFFAPDSKVIGNTIIGDDVSIWFNSVVRGDFRHDLSLKQEFFELVKQQSATNNY